MRPPYPGQCFSKQLDLAAFFNERARVDLLIELAGVDRKRFGR